LASALTIERRPQADGRHCPNTILYADGGLGGRGPISQMMIATTTRAMINAMLLYRSICATQPASV
jgi:hypothetical protein